MGLNQQSYTSCCILLLSTIIGLAVSLRLTKLEVPSHIGLHDTVSLVCEYDLGGGKLYSVKWYKDENEFYRYMPNNEPQKQTFAQDGITLDPVASDMNRVTLDGLSFGSSGSYQCEVSTEGPNFETASKSANMTVVVYPSGEPQIEGFDSKYSAEEYVTGNCTSAPSNPPPVITWYINGNMADSHFIERYPMVKSEGPLYSYSLGLRFLIQENKQSNLLRQSEQDGVIELKCSVTLPGLPSEDKWDTVKKIYSISYKNSNLGNQERFRNLGINFKASSCLLVVLLLCPAYFSFT